MILPMRSSNMQYRQICSKINFGAKYVHIKYEFDDECVWGTKILKVYEKYVHCAVLCIYDYMENRMKQLWYLALIFRLTCLCLQKAYHYSSTCSDEYSTNSTLTLPHFIIRTMECSNVTLAHSAPQMHCFVSIEQHQIHKVPCMTY